MRIYKNRAEKVRSTLDNWAKSGFDEEDEKEGYSDEEYEEMRENLLEQAKRSGISEETLDSVRDINFMDNGEIQVDFEAGRSVRMKQDDDFSEWEEEGEIRHGKIL